MEAAYINNNLSSGQSLQEVIATFFKTRTPDSAKVLFWKVFQCWSVQECKFKVDVSDEEIALFFDQLIDLVAAAHIEHEANRVSKNLQQGGKNE